MKTRLVLLILLMFVLTGCLGNKLQRGVKDNIIYSTYPEVAIKMATDFEYIDKQKSSENARLRNSEHTANTTVQRFMFADMVTQKMAIIEISRLEGSGATWIVDISDQVPNYISTGYEDHFGKSYQYVVIVNKDKNGECHLVKWSSRVIGSNGNILLNIFYSEVLDEKRQTLNCSTQTKVEYLSPGQKNRYDEFMKNCDKNMKFIDIASLNLEK